jgi:hypothetical protein
MVQKFPVDLAAMFPEGIFGPDTVQVKYSHVLLAPLKACLRSAVIKTSTDSTPLYECLAKHERSSAGGLNDEVKIL